MFHSVMSMSIVTLGLFVSFFILYENNMCAGLFAPQDIDIYALWLNKSYTKIASIGMGIFLAQLYLGVREAKAAKNFDSYKKASCCGRKWVAITSMFVSVGLLGFIGYAPRSANKDPPSWSRLKSASFITFSRPVFLLSIICIFYVLFLDHCLMCKRFVAGRFWTVLARLSYGVYLVFPIFSGQFSSSMGAPLYLTYQEMMYQMIFSIVGSFLTAMVIYLIWERPVVHLVYGHKFKRAKKYEEQPIKS